MHFTSLQPNTFTTALLFSAADFIKHYRQTGGQVNLKSMASQDVPIGTIDPQLQRYVVPRLALRAQVRRNSSIEECGLLHQICPRNRMGWKTNSVYHH